MMRLALSEDSLASLRADDSRRTLTRLSLNLVPFARIASLWFHRCCQAVAVPPWVLYLGYLAALVLLLAAAEQGAQLVFPAWALLLSITLLFLRPARGCPASR
jgi:hypothetical protein